MASLTVKNLPPELYSRLKDAARRHRRSLNGEAIHCLERVLQPARMDPADFLGRLDALHSRIALPKVSEEFLEEAIAEGRP